MSGPPPDNSLLPQQFYWDTSNPVAGKIWAGVPLAENSTGRTLVLDTVNIPAASGSGTGGGETVVPDVTLRAPTSLDDSDRGYAVNDLWLFGETVYAAVKVTPGLAVWRPVLAAAALPIDAVGGAAPVFAYGTMRLASAYTGHGVNVVRTSDSAARDIDFLPGNALDVASIDGFSPGAPVRVATFYDQSGTANDATAIVAERPAMAASNVIGPARSVIFDTTHSSSAGPAKTNMTIASMGAANANQLTFLCVMRAMDSAGPNIIPVEFNGAAYEFWAGYSGTGEIWILNRTGAQLQNIKARTTSVPEIFGCALGSAQTQLIVGNTIQTGVGTTSSTPISAATLGSSASASSSGAFETVVALAWARVLSATELLNARAALTRLFRVQAQVRDVLMIAGDSITFGTFQSMNIDYTRRVIPLLKTPMTVIANGRFGQTMAVMDANFATDYANAYNPKARNNILTIFAGTNDLAGSATGAVTWSHMVSFCAKAHAVGWKVAVVTMLPRGGLTAPQQAEWDSYNSLIRAGWWEVADALIDPAADDVIGPMSATVGTTYYGDGIHPVDGMPVYFAGLFAQAINGLLV